MRHLKSGLSQVWVKMAAVRLIPVQALLLCLALLSMLYVRKLSCLFMHTHWELLSLRVNLIPASELHTLPTSPVEMLATNSSPGYPTSRRQQPGRRRRDAGVLSRFRRRPYRPPLPALLLTNVRSIQNKINKLFLLIQINKDYKGCSVICLTETWLDHTMPDQAVTPPGFTLY